MSEKKKKRKNDAWVEVYVATSPEEAHIIAGKLIAADMPAHVVEAPKLLGASSGLPGLTRVFVQVRYLQAAEALLYPDDAAPESEPGQSHKGAQDANEYPH